MSAYTKLFKFAESQGITIPEVVKFLASPAGYTLSKALEAIESKAQLPQGIMSLAQNPVSGVTDYLKTQASNAIFNENEPSKVESILSELQGTNPDKPNYVGPQQPDSPLSQLNTAMLPYDLGVQPTGEFAGANSNNINMNDDLRSGMYGTQTENFPNFVGPLSEDSPAFLSDLSFLPTDLGVQPTAAVTSNTPTTATTSNTSSNSYLPALTTEFLQSILAPPSGVDPNRDAAKELLRDAGINQPNSSIFGTSTPESLGFTEVQSMPEMQEYFGGGGGNGGGGKYYDDFSSMAMARGGQIPRGIR